MRRFLSLTSVLAMAVVLLAVPASAAVPLRYVALGDSFASVGTLTAIRTDPIGCARSTDNYPSGVANRLGPAVFLDISCGGATTGDMTQPQNVIGGPNPPQFSALTPDTDLVTLTIGGNDIGFGQIVLTCASLSLTDPFGAPCKARFGNELTQRITQAAPLVDAVLAGIAARSPDARVVVVGYLRILPPSGGCWPVVPVSSGDVPFLDGVEQALNTMVGNRAAAAGAAFVNPGLTTGHDMCQVPGNKWVEGVIPTSLSVPVHPNATGQAHVADLVAAAVG